MLCRPDDCSALSAQPQRSFIPSTIISSVVLPARRAGYCSRGSLVVIVVVVLVSFLAAALSMTSTRAPVLPLDLKARIAALQQQQADASAKSSTSQILPKANAVNGVNALRDRIASFEKQGAVPKPKGRFGFAPSMQQDAVKRGELYGNRVPGLSRPHIPVPATTNATKKTTRSRSRSHLEELERYASSSSPPGSPFIFSDIGDAVGDVLSDGDLDSPEYSASQEDAQQASLDALMSQAGAEAEQKVEEVAEAPNDALAEPAARIAAETPDPGANQTEEAFAIVVPPSQAPSDAPALALVPDVAQPPPVPDSELEPELGPEPEPKPLAPSDHELAREPKSAPLPSALLNPTPDSPPAKPSIVIEPVDPDVQAVIDQLDRATRTGDTGSVFVPENALETFATIAPQQTGSTVADLLDQLLLQEDALDIATPVKQRFSLKDSLSSIAVRNYLTQQAGLAVNEGKITETSKSVEEQTPEKVTNTPPSGQFLSPNISHSLDSPFAEPLSPASDIYSDYLVATPAVRFGRGLPAIPEAPDSPLAINEPTRRDTFRMDSDGSTPPSSASLGTPTDDGRGSITPGDSTARLGNGSPPRRTSPPLSVVIPGATPKQQTDGPVEGQQPLPEADRPVSSPATAGDLLVPVPPSASDSSLSSPGSAYSLGSTYSATSLSSSAPMSRKVSRSSKTSSKIPSLLPPVSRYEEPLLTPLDRPKGFHAVVHEKVVEGKSRPVSMVQQYEDLPSPTPKNAANMGDLAVLLADYQKLEEHLANDRTPQKPKKSLPARPAPPSSSTPPPPIGRVQSPSSAYTTFDGPNHGAQDFKAILDGFFATFISLDRIASQSSLDQYSSEQPSVDGRPTLRPQLQPLFLTADPNAVRIPLPPRPKSAGGSHSQSSTPSVPAAKDSPKGTGYLSNLLSRAKSSGNLRSTPDPRNSAGSSSDDSTMVSTPPTPPYEMPAPDTDSVRSSRMFKHGLSRATTFADRLLHRKDGSHHQDAEVTIVSGDEDENGFRALPRPPRPLPLPPRPLPPRGLPPPVPGEPQSANNFQPGPPPGQGSLQRRHSWKSLASGSTTDINVALDNFGVQDSLPSGAPVPRAGLPSGPSGFTSPPGANAYVSPRPAPLPPMPPPNHPLPPPPSNQPLPPSRVASRGLPPVGYGLPSNPAARKTLPSRPKMGQPVLITVPYAFAFAYRIQTA
ncbi:hypothetical protein LXA43DRAFT_1097369 [Ganoderma leucocontextum]|nr:hypothetical protein LXA43DRAFT_1097369 [Ganoderma leucocontextum]